MSLVELDIVLLKKRLMGVDRVKAPDLDTSVPLETPLAMLLQVFCYPRQMGLAMPDGLGMY